MPARTTVQPPRIQIEDPQPRIDCGRYRPKRCVGDAVRISATIIRDGHEILRAAVRYRQCGSRKWFDAPMRRVDAEEGGDRWEGEFPVDAIGRWQWTIEAWTDPWAAWRHEMERKIAVAQSDLSGELSEGRVFLQRALERTKKAGERKQIQSALDVLEDASASQQEQWTAALDPGLGALVERLQERTELATLAQPIELWVDRERARFSTWYELFPRSFGGFAGVTEQLPKLAELGFDVLYLPPIHPIGLKNRKGRNTPEFPGGNPTAEAGEPGSPWAIGGEAGGHDAVHPELGTEGELQTLIDTAREHGIDVALDLAIQCSADHPWLTEHPEWFQQRPDGSLKYAENPPKKYQDIYNLDWNCSNWEELWEALYQVVRKWSDMGVRVYRVDNPHTKPLPFWEWLIGRIREDFPETIFLAEAFTRAAMMTSLAKVGFNQSYSYFTWKNSRWELQEYVNELAYTQMSEVYRPNFFANTPDILHAYLVGGGPRAFYIRFALAATLSPSYGIYSGYEHYENVPVREGSEEYQDSEKYVAKDRALDGPMLPFVQRLNEIRREHPALQRLDNVTFLETHNDALIAYAKRTGNDTIICVVTVDPEHAQEGAAIVPYEIGLPPAFTVHDLLSGERYDWRMGPNFVRLDPHERVAHVFRVEAQG